MDIFERAIVGKLRININNFGNVMAEDLYDMSLENLDATAKFLKKEVAQGEDDSFIKPANVNPDVKLRFDLVVHVINYKLKLREENEQCVEKKARKEKILAFMANKADEDMKNLSLDELTKLLDKV